jgi:hypothetical protein
MRFRVATLNLEQDHKRWDARRDLVHAELDRLKPDIMAFNEVCIPLRSARVLRDGTPSLSGYRLVQQTRANGLSKVEGEALLTRFEIVETGNFDYQTKDIVALVARVLVAGTALDIYVTHLFMSRGDDSFSCRAATIRCACFKCSNCWGGSIRATTSRHRSSAAISTPPSTHPPPR